MPIVSLQEFADHTATYVRGAKERTLVTRDGVPAIAVTPVKNPRRPTKKAFGLTMRELSRETHRAVREIENKSEAEVTYRGKVTAKIEKIDQDAFAAWMLATAPQFVESMRHADADFAAGKDKPLSEFIDRLED